jgi:hypothetical protein
MAEPALYRVRWPASNGPSLGKEELTRRHHLHPPAYRNDNGDSGSSNKGWNSTPGTLHDDIGLDSRARHIGSSKTIGLLPVLRGSLPVGFEFLWALVARPLTLKKSVMARLGVSPPGDPSKLRDFSFEALNGHSEAARLSRAAHLSRLVVTTLTAALLADNHNR